MSHTKEQQEQIRLVLAAFPAELLEAWNTEAKIRYPNFEMVLAIRPAIEETPGEGDAYKDYNLHYRPLPTARVVDRELDFPTDPLWEDMDYFETALAGNQIELIFKCYPDEDSFSLQSVPESPIELSEEDRSLLTVAEILATLEVKPAAT